MRTEQPDVSVVIVSWNTRDLLAQCLESLQETVRAKYEVWVVDNHSSDDSVEMIRARFSTVQVIANTDNAGFVSANNQALPRCQGRHILLLNSDTRVLPGSVDDAVRFLDEHPAAGLVGVRLLNPDGTFQASYTPFPTLWLEFLTLAGLGKRFVRPRFPSYGPLVERGPCKVEGYMEGAYLMARRDAVAQVGSLDEQIFMYAEDVDWCYRFRRANWEVWYLAHIAIVHYGGQSTRQRSGPMEAELYRSRIYFFGKHYGPAAAWLLKAMIYTITPIKWVVHRGVRLVSGGKKGRNVVGWRQLYATLHRDS